MLIWRYHENEGLKKKEKKEEQTEETKTIQKLSKIQRIVNVPNFCFSKNRVAKMQIGGR